MPTFLHSVIRQDASEVPLETQDGMNRYTICIVDPFGYGWSDITNKERTVENIVKETILVGEPKIV